MRATFSSLAIAIALVLIGGIPARAQGFNRVRPDFFELGYEKLEEEIENLQRLNSTSVLTIETPTQQLTRAILPAGRCSAKMPLGGTITQGKRMIETRAGEVKFDFISSNSSSSRFVLGATQELQPAILAESDNLLTQVRDRITRNMGDFELVPIEEQTIDGNPAIDFKLENSQENIAFRVLLAEKRLYLLAVGQINKSVSPETIAEFFQSFEIIER